MGQVTLTLEEFSDLQQSIKIRDEEIIALKRRLDAARDSATTNDEAKLVALIRLGLPIIQFAVANCDPLTVPGWPFEKLETFGRNLPSIPTLTEQEEALGHELQTVPREIAVIEVARAQKPTPA